MRPWLSILIPVYDVERYLEECLASVLAQRLADVEVVVVDDASTERSPALLDEISRRSPHPIDRIRHERNQGVSAARNTLLDAATGTYCWFLDSDDALTPGKRVDAASAPAR